MKDKPGRLRRVAAGINVRLQHVLIVDDRLTQGRIIMSMLLALGFQRERLILADSGDEAIAVLADLPIDLIITGNRMPSLQGTGLLRYVKDSPRLQHIPVILMSEDTDTQADAMRKGAAGFVRGRFLRSTLEQHLNRPLTHNDDSILGLDGSACTSVESLQAVVMQALLNVSSPAAEAEPQPEPALPMRPHDPTPPRQPPWLQRLLQRLRLR